MIWSLIFQKAELRHAFSTRTKGPIWMNSGPGINVPLGTGWSHQVAPRVAWIPSVVDVLIVEILGLDLYGHFLI